MKAVGSEVEAFHGVLRRPRWVLLSQVGTGATAVRVGVGRVELQDPSEGGDGTREVLGGQGLPTPQHVGLHFGSRAAFCVPGL